MESGPHVAPTRTPAEDRFLDLLRLYETAADGVAGELDAVAHGELLEDVRAMALDRLLGDEEHLADLLVGVRLGDELDDLLLAGREHLATGRFAGAGALDVLAHQRPDAAG